ncbi:MAG: hypothetical protein H8D67_19800 [Deltaproteobacteria bacterium]|nr:hypothetical protein [Deltaproteobacteria bacterium]MBL7178191.1 hypothetical protein [Desulfobacteraceae bacterium]
MGRHAEAKEAIDPSIEVALKIGYQRRLLQIYSLIGQYNINVEEDFTKGLHHFEEALRISEEINDMGSLGLANSGLSGALFSNCEFKRAISHMEKAHDIYLAANNLRGIVATKSTLCHWYNYQGRLDFGYKTSHEALRIAEESGDIYSNSFAYTRCGTSCYYKGYLEEAVDYLLKGIDFSERLNSFENIYNAQSFLALAYIEIGEYKKAKDHSRKPIIAGEQAGTGLSRINLSKMSLARARTMNNEKDIDLESLYGYAYENKFKIFDGRMRRYLGEILLYIDDQHISQAEDWIKKAIEVDEMHGMMWYLGRDYALYADLFKRKGDQSKAKENLNKAIEILKECGADGWVEKYEKELALFS